MKQIVLIIFTFIMAFYLNNKILNATELLAVRVAENYYPYEVEEDGEFSGLHIDLVYAVAKRINVNVKFKSLPWKRAIKTIKNGKADAITYIGKTPERESFIYFEDGNILSSSNYGFIVLKNRSININYNGDLKSMAKYTIGIQRGYSYGNEFDQATYLQKLSVNKINQMLAMLEKSRIDLAVIDEPEFLQNKDKWTNITFLQPVITNRNFYIGFSKAKKLDKLAKAFSREMIEIKQSEEYQKMLTKYKLYQ